ncbi:outer dense fiber protein 3-like [Microplitis mediator]|uniref:outer dense fiber protein 3-like n=1 Tax=Microplitis mediator TaxID=375433 RepID=UPI002553241B|nr:outer dense fiber protein 3-like [Microplitis mediator]
MGGLTQRQWSPTKRRGPISAEFRSPGPACVSLPSLIGKTVPDSKRGRAPAFSFGSRYSLKNESPGPGPGQYNVSGLSAKGKNKAPALSLHGYTKIDKIECTPAPGDYDPEKAEIFIQDSSPKYSFGVKAHIEKINSTPAPNVYIIPSAFGATKEGNKKAAPAYSIASRQKVFTDDRILVPGPGTYEAIDPDIVRSKSAAYSMSGRYQLPTDQSKIPAPGVYCPEKVLLNFQPAHTFGIKHSPYICNLKDADNQFY